MPTRFGDIDLGAELRQLHGAHVGDDEADQEADQGHDRQGLRSDVLDDQQQVRPAKLRLAAQQPAEGQ